MNIIEKAVKILLKSLFFIIMLPALYLIFAIILGLITTEKSDNCKAEKILYLSKGDFHLDIVISADDIDSNLNLGLYSENDKFFAFGWGDRDFYRASSLKDAGFGVIFKALFLKSDASIHVTRYKSKNRNWLTIRLCKKQLEIIMEYINASFKSNSEMTKIILKGESYFNHDEFYESTESYSCFKTCNTWVGSGLKKADLKTPVWTPFQYGITRNFK